MMVVTAERASGTIGGGHLELKAIEFAREMIALKKTAATRRHFPLGPALGQCCGGNVDVAFVPVLGPVDHNEKLFEKEAARLALLSHGASRNFRKERVF